MCTGLLYPKFRGQSSGIIQKLYETRHDATMGVIKSVYWLFSEIFTKMLNLAHFPAKFSFLFIKSCMRPKWINVCKNYPYTHSNVDDIYSFVRFCPKYLLSCTVFKCFKLVASTNTYNVRQESWSWNLSSGVGNFCVSCCKCGVIGDWGHVNLSTYLWNEECNVNVMQFY